MRVTVAVLLALGTVACGSNGPSPPSAPYSQTDLVVGTGDEAVNGRRATMEYTGWLYDPAQPESKGSMFDTSIGRPVPFSFTVGSSEVIAGWNRGVPGMRVGGRRRLIIPADLGYGSDGRGPIPGGATLVFDIELLSVG